MDHRQSKSYFVLALYTGSTRPFKPVRMIFLYFSIKTDNIPEHKLYIEDYIYNVKWRWSWAINNIYNLWCFCPNCDATLVYNDSSVRDFYASPKTEFICENCNATVATIKGGDKEWNSMNLSEKSLSPVTSPSSQRSQ